MENQNDWGGENAEISNNSESYHNPGFNAWSDCWKDVTAPGQNGPVASMSRANYPPVRPGFGMRNNDQQIQVLPNGIHPHHHTGHPGHHPHHLMHLNQFEEDSRRVPTPSSGPTGFRNISDRGDTPPISKNVTFNPLKGNNSNPSSETTQKTQNINTNNNSQYKNSQNNPQNNNAFYMQQQYMQNPHLYQNPMHSHFTHQNHLNHLNSHNNSQTNLLVKPPEDVFKFKHDHNRRSQNPASTVNNQENYTELAQQQNFTPQAKTTTTTPTSQTCPWIKHNKQYKRGSEGLTEEIHDFLRYIETTPEEHYMRRTVVKRIKKVIKDVFPHAKIRVFGSYKTGLYLPTSDIDVSVIMEDLDTKDKVQSKKALDSLKHALLANQMFPIIDPNNRHNDLKVLENAQIPIIKFRDWESSVNVDISLNIQRGIATVELVKQYLIEYPCLKSLVFVLKQFLLQRDLNEVWTGGLSSYSIVLLVVSFLQSLAISNKEHKPTSLTRINEILNKAKKSQQQQVSKSSKNNNNTIDSTTDTITNNTNSNSLQNSNNSDNPENSTTSSSFPNSSSTTKVQNSNNNNNNTSSRRNSQGNITLISSSSLNPAAPSSLSTTDTRKLLSELEKFSKNVVNQNFSNSRSASSNTANNSSEQTDGNLANIPLPFSSRNSSATPPKISKNDENENNYCSDGNSSSSEISSISEETNSDDYDLMTDSSDSEEGENSQNNSNSSTTSSKSNNNDEPLPDSENLGMLLIYFFELYARHFDYKNHSITVRNESSLYIPKKQMSLQMQGFEPEEAELKIEMEEEENNQSSPKRNLDGNWRREVPKKENNQDFNSDEMMTNTDFTGETRFEPGILSIEDPLLPSNDVGKGSYAAGQVRQAYDSAYRILQRAIHTKVPAQGKLDTFHYSSLSRIIKITDEVRRYREWIKRKYKNKLKMHERRKRKRRELQKNVVKSVEKREESVVNRLDDLTNELPSENRFENAVKNSGNQVHHGYSNSNPLPMPHSNNKYDNLVGQSTVGSGSRDNLNKTQVHIQNHQIPPQNDNNSNLQTRASPGQDKINQTNMQNVNYNQLLAHMHQQHLQAQQQQQIASQNPPPPSVDPSVNQHPQQQQQYNMAGMNSAIWSMLMSNPNLQSYMQDPTKMAQFLTSLSQQQSSNYQNGQNNVNQNYPSPQQNGPQAPPQQNRPYPVNPPPRHSPVNHGVRTPQNNNFPPQNFRNNNNSNMSNQVDMQAVSNFIVNNNNMMQRGNLNNNNLNQIHRQSPTNNTIHPSSNQNRYSPSTANALANPNVTPTNNNNQPHSSYATVLRSGSSNSSEDRDSKNEISRGEVQNGQNSYNSNYRNSNSNRNSNYRQNISQNSYNSGSRPSYNTRESHSQNSVHSRNNQTDSNNNPQTPHHSIEDILRKTNSVNPRLMEGSSRDDYDTDQNNFNSDSDCGAEVSLTYNRTLDSSKPNFDRNMRNSSTEPEPESISTDQDLGDENEDEESENNGSSSEDENNDFEDDDVTPRNKLNFYENENKMASDRMQTVYKKYDDKNYKNRKNNHNSNTSTPVIKPSSSKSDFKINSKSDNYKIHDTKSDSKLNSSKDRLFNQSSPRTNRNQESEENNQSTPKQPKTPTAGTGSETQKSSGTPGSGSRTTRITPQFLAMRAFGEIKAQATKNTTPRRSLDTGRKDSLSTGVGSESNKGSESQISVKRSLTRPSPSPSPNKPSNNSSSRNSGKMKKSSSGVKINLDNAGSGQNSGTKS